MLVNRELILIRTEPLFPTGHSTYKMKISEIMQPRGRREMCVMCELTPINEYEQELIKHQNTFRLPFFVEWALSQTLKANSQQRRMDRFKKS